MKTKTLLLVGAAVLLTACNPSAPPAPADTTAVAAPASEAPAAPAPTPAPAPAPAPASTAPAAAFSTADFTDKVWKVSAASGSQVGSTYVFLADGTLVVDADNSTPMYGRWAYDGGKLTMTEEGQAYPTDILELDAGTLRIRSHNPGGVVDMTLVPAPGVPLPPASPPAQ